MKIAFFSNFLNHHQLPLCQDFLNASGVEFIFVATEPIEKERLEMGYEDMNLYPFVLRAYEHGEEACILAKECDVMIFGSAPIKYLKLRMEENKPTFYFTERLLRKGYFRRFIPTTRKKINEQYINYKDKNLYALCASAFASYDLKLCGFNKDKCFKWGYFPKIVEKDLAKLMDEKDKNERVEILYAGRLLKLKRVMDTVKALNLLVKRGVKNFKFTIIGEGEEKKRIERYIKKRKLDGYIQILPFTSPDKVREWMDLTDVYVFSSNMFEGWGAVMNEALNSACAVVVSHSVGSAPYLIKSGENGLIYACGKVKDLASRLEKVIADKEFRREIALKGYQTITSEWTSDIATERLLKLCNNLSESSSLYESGILSIATPLKNDWIKGEKI